MCRALPDLGNGTISYHPVSTTFWYESGAKADYQCNSGYLLSEEGTHERTCINNNSDNSLAGVWNGTTPKCLGKLN